MPELRVVGGPVRDKVVIGAGKDQTFAAIFPLLAAAVGDEALWARWQLHPARLDGRVLRPRARVVQATDTPASLRLGGAQRFLMLRTRAGPNDEARAPASAARRRRGVFSEPLGAPADGGGDCDRGLCPRCGGALAACAPAVAAASPGDVAAFCFLCRRAFSVAELAARDRLLGLLRRTRRGEQQEQQRSFSNGTRRNHRTT